MSPSPGFLSQLSEDLSTRPLSSSEATVASRYPGRHLRGSGEHQPLADSGTGLGTVMATHRVTQRARQAVTGSSPVSSKETRAHRREAQSCSLTPLPGSAPRPLPHEPRDCRLHREHMLSHPPGVQEWGPRGSPAWTLRPHPPGGAGLHPPRSSSRSCSAAWLPHDSISS